MTFGASYFAKQFLGKGVMGTFLATCEEFWAIIIWYFQHYSHTASMLRVTVVTRVRTRSKKNFPEN